MTARERLLAVLRDPGSECLCGDDCPTPESLIDDLLAEDAEQHAVIADVPDDDQPTRAQASVDKLRALFAGGCMPAAQYTTTRGEPGEGQ